MITLNQWEQIRRLHYAEGLGVRTIARELGLARNTVRTAVRSSVPPRYERASAGSAVDAVETDIRRLLRETPTMPATVIAERVGWTRGMTILRDRVREIRPDYLLPQGYGRTTYQPGELAQWDLWWPAADIPVGWAQTARAAGACGRVGVLALAAGAHDRLQAGLRRAGRSPVVSDRAGAGAPQGRV